MMSNWISLRDTQIEEWEESKVSMEVGSVEGILGGWEGDWVISVLWHGSGIQLESTIPIESRKRV